VRKEDHLRRGGQTTSKRKYLTCKRWREEEEEKRKEMREGEYPQPKDQPRTNNTQAETTRADQGGDHPRQSTGGEERELDDGTEDEVGRCPPPQPAPTPTLAETTRADQGGDKHELRTGEGDQGQDGGAEGGAR
jgi:hypothetical protein